MTEQALPRLLFLGLSQRSLQVILTLFLAIGMGSLLATYLSPDTGLVAGITLFCIGMWATAAVPEYWPALAFFLVASLLELAGPEVIFSGFLSSAFWLLFAGIVLGASIGHTGLGKRAAILVSAMLGQTYLSALIGIVTFGILLAFIMPSSIGRVVLLIPIIIALADHMGYELGRNGRTGMVMAAAFGTTVPAFTILPANGPNMILAGLSETVLGTQLPYWDYLVLHFPVLGLGKASLVIVMILWLFPDTNPKKQTAQTETSQPWSRSEKQLGLLLISCLILWATDALHKISPGWVGLAAALICLLPSSKLTAENTINQKINYGTLLFVGGLMGLGAVISASGLGQMLIGSLTDHVSFSPDRPFTNVVALTGVSSILAMVTNLPTVPAVMTPLAQEFVSVTELPLITVLMTQVLAFSNIFLPYQAPPLIAAMQLGQLTTGQVTKFCLILFGLTFLVLMPLDLIWWKLLGLV